VTAEASGQGPDALAEKLLAHSTATEALEWLKREDAVVRTLGESDSSSDCIVFVEGLYRAGAVKVVATEIDQYEREDVVGIARYENTGHLVLELPNDSALRSKLFKEAAKVARGLGFDPSPDVGQRYLYMMLD
jgi:hypothetical protein